MLNKIKIPKWLTIFGAVTALNTICYSMYKSQQIKTLLQYVLEIQDKIDIIISNNFTFNIPSMDDIYTILNNLTDYLSSLDIVQQLIILNVIVSVFLLSLLLEYHIGLYGNFLIEKFNLNNRFPKLGKFIQYRMLYQKYYFRYLSLIAFFTLFFYIIYNLFLF